jgi:hypothetical protein
MTSLDDLLNEISERGWLVNNLFQLSSGDWQANLRSHDFITSFGVATTPSGALSLALDSIETAKEYKPEPITHSVAPSDISSILARLIKPSEPIKRRI